MTTSLQDTLARLHACPEGIEWAKNYKTASAAWIACENPDWMLWALEAIRWKDDSLLRRIACWCARNTPLIDGRTTWDLLTDPNSRAAVETAERFADGKATQEELRAAGKAAWAAASGTPAGNAAWSTTTGNAAWDTAGAAAWAAASLTHAGETAWSTTTETAAWDTAGAAAWAAAAPAIEPDAWISSWKATGIAQANAIRAIIGNPFRDNL